MIIDQVIYYQDDYELNNPFGLTKDMLVSGILFNDIICDEIQIKTSPNVILYINNKEILIGDIGIYNIMLKENMKIFTLKVKAESLDYINEHKDSNLIITFIQKEN